VQARPINAAKNNPLNILAEVGFTGSTLTTMIVLPKRKVRHIKKSFPSLTCNCHLASHKVLPTYFNQQITNLGHDIYFERGPIRMPLFARVRINMALREPIYMSNLFTRAYCMTL
jgi:hypothetical protein